MALSIGILTVSDRVAAGAMEDQGGPAVRAALASEAWTVSQTAVVPDDAAAIQTILLQWCDEEGLDVVFTTGGTGLGPRDVTPEATADVADRIVPGIAEAIRAFGLRQTQAAMLSRALAVVRSTTLIINLPGSPRGAAEGVEVVRPVLEHAASTLRGSQH